MTATSSHPETTSSSPQAQPLLSQPQLVVVIPTYPLPHRHRFLRRSCRRCLLISAALVVLLLAAGYLLWPSDPDVSIVRVKLSGLHVQTRPKISLDVTFNVTVRIRNVDLYSVYYDSLNVSIGYRGKELGFATSRGEMIRSREVSYVDATVVVDGVEVLSDMILFIEDLSKGAVAFDTEAVVDGRILIFDLLDLPLKTKVSCEVIVSPKNQTIMRQSCYPEASEL